MAEFSMDRPFNKADIYYDLRLDPVLPHTRQTDGSREWRFWYLEFVESLAQIEQQFRIESRSDLSREDEVVAFVVSNQQCAETHSFALRIRKTTDEKIL